jgi:two-component system, NarL family, sensor kinase
MKASLCLFITLLGTLPTHSQTATDSLLAMLKKTSVNRGSLQQSLNALEKMPPEEIKKIQIIGDWIILNSNTDSLLEINSTANLVVGKKFTTLASFAEATRYLTRAQILSEKNKYPLIQAQALNALGSIYKSNEQEEKAIDYFKKSLAISKENNYLHGMARALFNLGNLQIGVTPASTSNTASALNLMLQGLNIVHQLQDTQSLITQTRGLAGVYMALKDFDAALIKLKEAEQLMKLTGKEYDFVLLYNQVAKIYSEKRKFAAAIQYYEAGLHLAKKYNVPRLLCMYYSGMAETYEKTGNYKKANKYNQLNIKMHDALVSRENFAAAADIQNSYERAKKDNELLKLAALNKQRSTINMILVSATFGLLLIGILGYKNFRSRNKIYNQQQEIQQQRIIQLEKDKQIISIDAMLKGQEEERSRIAKDLHDGIGSLLSGTKLSFMNVKESLNLESETNIQFDKSLSLLDNTIGDLRKVAQNLMPEALVKFGLHEAVRDFCDAVQASSGINIRYHHFGENRKLDNTATVFIYRIIQELVNNSVKHAQASEIIVQVSTTKGKTGITVEDNGIGFDKDLLVHSAGAGMSNVQFRVQYFNGTSDIVTSPGNGTSVNIELNV